MLKRLYLRLILVFALPVLALAGGCGGGGGPTYGPPVTWNFLVYLDGDNDLEAAAIDDINEMERVGSTEYVNVFVLIDRHSSSNTSGGYIATTPDWDGTRLYRITKDTTNAIASERIYWRAGEDSEDVELDMSDPAVLQQFITYIQTNYPAERTVLTLWNHGGGVYPRSMKPDRGICWDETTNPTNPRDPWSCLTTDEVAEALGGAHSATGKKIDIINMDACLMQLLEVAYEWRQYADYLAGSEENVPGDGNDYTAALSNLNPGMTAEQLAVQLVNDYYSFYNGVDDTTYSALRLDAIEALASTFGTFASELKNDPAEFDDILEAWRHSTHFGYPELVDLYTFADEAGAHVGKASLKSAAAALKIAVGNAVRHHRETGFFAGLNKAYGLCVLVPTYNEWGAYSGDDQYNLLQLSQDCPDWYDFVSAFAAYTGSDEVGVDSLKFELIWPWGDCDLGVLEPDGIDYWAWYHGYSPNGDFSEDEIDGGSETWTLRASHDPGQYWPLVGSWPSADGGYSGSATLIVTMNGATASVTFNISYDQLLIFSDFYIVKTPGGNELRYKLIQQPLPDPPAKKK